MDRRHFLRLSTSAAVGLGACKGTWLQAIAADVPAHEQHIYTLPSSQSSDADADDKGLTVRFLGTGAADWNGPDARGEHRRRTSLLVDGSILIDFTPTDADMLPEDVHPKVIFYTHSHDDHYNPQAAMTLGVTTAYVSDTWRSRAQQDFSREAARHSLVAPKVFGLHIGDKVKIGNITFTALPANHATSDPNEQTMLYLIEKGDVRLLYATDTGGIPVAAARLVGIDGHQQGTPITALIMEATMGMGTDSDEDFRLFTHSSVNTVLHTVNALKRVGRYQPKENQSAYLTHMARGFHGTQQELDAQLPSPLKAAYDGLEVRF